MTETSEAFLAQRYILPRIEIMLCTFRFIHRPGILDSKFARHPGRMPKKENSIKGKGFWAEPNHRARNFFRRSRLKPLAWTKKRYKMGGDESTRPHPFAF